MVEKKANLEQDVMDITRTFLQEMGAERALQRLSIDASLDRDLGIDSLGRVELFYRLEKTFGAQLSESLMADAATLKEIVRGLEESPTLTTENHSRRAHAPSQAPLAAGTESIQTIVDALYHHVEADPTRPHVYFQDEQGAEHVLTYGALLDAAREVARGLVERGLRPGETVAIMLPTCLDFFYAFFGVQLAGGVPVPIYPPFRPNKIEEYVRREAIILRNAEVKFLITFDRAENLSQILRGFIPSLNEVVTTTLLRKSKAALPSFLILPHDAAFIQYTSGSTGDPKGVLLSHGNLIANLKAVDQVVKIAPTDVMVSWLPLYHDMGLIGAWMGSLVFGVPLVLMSPLTFLTRPERWLWAIHAHRGTITAAPNFAYELCLRKIDERAVEGLDLSSWRLALNGAEAVHPRTIEKFTERFKAFGFKPETMYPVYGLAESSVALTFPPVGRAPWVDTISRQAFEEEQKAVPPMEENEDTISFVSCGKAIPGHDVQIRDAAGHPLPERVIGSVWFRGPSAMQGYYRNVDATRAISSEGGWYNSGDLAYQAEGEIFLAGRKKDLIIKAGRNIYPQEVEDAAGRVEGVRKGNVIAFGITDDARGTEKLVVVAELSASGTIEKNIIRENIYVQISEELGIAVDDVILVKIGVVPKTSSGKLQRSLCKKMYEDKTLGAGSLPMWAQVSKLFVLSFVKKGTAIVKNAAVALYTFYFWFVFSVLFSAALLTIFSLPRASAQKGAKFWSRLWFALAGIPVRVEGRAYLEADQPTLYVANHASYLDAILLTGLLPAGVLFVAKREVNENWLLRRIFAKLGHLTVDRVDVTQSLSDLGEMEAVIAGGSSLALFPEGTFTYADGVRPFKLGAFKLASERGAPLCAISLKGTRRLLRDVSWRVHPCPLTVTVDAPRVAASQEWADVVKMRQEVRAWIATHASEPLLEVSTHF